MLFRTGKVENDTLFSVRETPRCNSVFQEYQPWGNCSVRNRQKLFCCTVINIFMPSPANANGELALNSCYLLESCRAYFFVSSLLLPLIGNSQGFSFYNLTIIYVWACHTFCTREIKFRVTIKIRAVIQNEDTWTLLLNSWATLIDVSEPHLFFFFGCYHLLYV